jgi:hypothetical protein
MYYCATIFSWMLLVLTQFWYCSENVFEDGNQLYRFLDHDPLIMTQCYNIPRGIIDVAPKPIVEVASRLRLLSYAIFEAHVSEDGKHVDYTSIQGCEEFKRLAVSTWYCILDQRCKKLSIFMV